MVTEREEKLAAARKKLARFQQTKTAGHQRPPSQQPKLETIGRGVEESNSSSSNEQTRNTSPDSLNGVSPNPTHNLMYSNPTPTFEESDILGRYVNRSPRVSSEVFKLLLSRWRSWPIKNEHQFETPP